MKRIIVLTFVAAAVLTQTLASADEGPLLDIAPVIEAGRQATYSGATSAGVPAADSTKSRLHRNARQKPDGARTLRSPSAAQSTNFSDFYIYDARSTLRADRDNDGYHAEFRIRFDADVLSGDATVYARLYLRRAGEKDWILYHETDDFFISGTRPDDAYYVTTTLDDGYSTDDYDVLIDLYESGYSGIVATLGPQTSGALSYLPLEEVGLDTPIGIPGYRIKDVRTELITDNDHDGHYSRFRITFDPDADFERRRVYASIWVRARGGEWIEEYATDDFIIETSGQSDAYALNVDWRTGYPTSFYDVQIDVHDAASDLLVASVGSNRLDLAQIPLEDSSRDQYVSAPTPNTGGNTSSREGGGGAFGMATLLALSVLGLLRNRRMLPKR